MNIITLPVELISVNDLRDRSCKMIFETRELTNAEFSSLRDIRGTQGWLGFSLDEIQEKDMPTEQVEKGTKTPSQRLRAVLYILWTKEKEAGTTELNFDVYYLGKVESIINKIKLLIDQK